MKMQILIPEVWVGPEICISHLIPGDALVATFPWTTFDKQGPSTFLPLLAIGRGHRELFLEGKALSYFPGGLLYFKFST